MSFHLRRKDKEITDERLLKKILKTTKYVTIALSMNDEPYLVSLSHGYDEKKSCVYFHCAREGKKLQYLRSNNTVWGQALLDCGYSEGECTYLYASVHFTGSVTILENLEEKREALACMIRQIDKNPETLLADLRPERLRNTVIGRIDIAYMSGKKSKEVMI
jgi:nitroimidazol reductase NimA-like FMN-containing flavoprotein (pyridoxamine 5'-phosphate oxidase superfamily)